MVCSGPLAQLCAAGAATENHPGALPALRVVTLPPPAQNFERGLFTLAGHFSWGKCDCTFADAGERRLYPIYYAVSPSSCSLVTELQVSKMIAITENSVFCAALDFSIMSHHYDLG